MFFSIARIYFLLPTNISLPSSKKNQVLGAPYVGLGETKGSGGRNPGGLTSRRPGYGHEPLGKFAQAAPPAGPLTSARTRTKLSQIFKMPKKSTFWREKNPNSGEKWRATGRSQVNSHQKKKFGRVKKTRKSNFQSKAK